MTWVQIDDAIAANPKVSALSDAAFRMHLYGLCHCAQGLTDGVVDDNSVPRMHAKWRKNLAELTAKRTPESKALWEKIDGGYRINDYLEYNPSRQDVSAARAKKAEAGRLGGLARAKANAQAVATSEADAQASSKQSPQPQPLKIVLPQSSVVDGLTIKYLEGTNRNRAAQRLLDVLKTSATDGTVGRITNLMKMGATESDFANAYSAVRAKPTRNPAAYACKIVEASMLEREKSA